MAYMGPIFLGMLAIATADPAARHAALAEAEALLATNSISHDHMLFRRDAIDACLGGQAWDQAERHAVALEAFGRQEPLPWTLFFVARGRALAAHGQGRQDRLLMAELERLMGEDYRIGPRVALPQIAAALAVGEATRS